MDRYGVSERLSACFIRAGVLPGLAQLGREELYRLLMDMPTLSPDGKASRALCRWFLSNEADLLGFAGENRERFFRQGKIWGSNKEENGYFAISELRHVDYDGLPPALLLKLSVADLPKRVGSQKVREILGIKPLERSEIRQELISHQPSPVHDVIKHGCFVTQLTKTWRTDQTTQRIGVKTR